MLVWNLYAIAYDVINKNAPYRRLLQDVIGELDLGAGQKLLDVGCGTGNLASEILGDSPALRIVGIDISPAMLRRAKGKIEKKDNIEFRLLNADEGTGFS